MILHTSGWRTDVRWETNCLSFFFYTDLTFRSPLALLTVKVDHAKLWWIIWEKRDKLSPHAFTLDKPSTQLLPAIITGNVQRTATDAKLSLQPWTPSPTTDTNALLQVERASSIRIDLTELSDLTYWLSLTTSSSLMAPPSICCTLVAAIFLICCPINGVDSLSRPGSSVSSRRRGLVDTSEVPVLRSTCIANRSGGLPRCTDIKTRSIPVSRRRSGSIYGISGISDPPSARHC